MSCSINTYNKSLRVADDTSVALKVRCYDYVTAATVQIATTDVTLTRDGDAVVFDLTATAYDTAGEFIAAMNALEGWEAVIVDSLQSSSVKDSKLLMVNPSSGALTGTLTTDATVADGVKFGWDSSVTKEYIVSIQQEDLPSKTNTSGLSDVTDDAIENLAYSIIGGYGGTTTGTNTMSVYKCVGTTDTLMNAYLGAQVTTPQTFYSSDTVPTSAGAPQVGGRLVCSLTVAAGVTSGFIEVQGQSVNRVRDAIDCGNCC
jgi:hypothetical protein